MSYERDVSYYDKCVMCDRPNRHIPLQTTYSYIEDTGNGGMIFHDESAPGRRFRKFTQRPCTLSAKCAPLPTETVLLRAMERLQTPEDYQILDAEIRPYVKKCMDAGLITIWSCDGHNRHEPYIEFVLERHRDAALELLPFKQLNVKYQKKVHLNGTLYGIKFAMGTIPGSKPRRDR